MVNFIWDNKKAKISIKLLQASKESRGLGLVNLRKKDCALKVCWVAILEQDEKYECLAYQLFALRLKRLIWLCNVNASDVKYITRSTFWSDVLSTWSLINFKENVNPIGQL